MLLPKDPNDEKNAFIEIRAGTGGDEAGLFTGDLFRMFSGSLLGFFPAPVVLS